MKKKIIALFLAIAVSALCIPFAACGESGGGGTENGVFEAEYAQLPSDGAGWSGGGGGKDTVGFDLGGEWNASNGYYLTNLYIRGATITFKINSDSATDDAKIILRLSAEDPTGMLNSGNEDSKTFSITSETYQVKVNGTALTYETITFNKIQKVNKFADYTIAGNVHLSQGENVIELVTNNDKSLGGTTLATAPLVDALKIKTSANLSWEPNTDNIGE